MARIGEETSNRETSLRAIDGGGTGQDAQALFTADLRQSVRQQSRVRRRALGDALLVALATVGAAHSGGDAHEAVMAGSATLSLGILAFVARRSRDLEALARQARWRENAVEGRGLKLTEWRAGKQLPSWEERRASASPAATS